MCQVLVGSINKLPPNSERTVFSAIESLLANAHRKWTTELVVEFDAEDVQELTARAQQEDVMQKLTCRPTGLDDKSAENFLTIVVINAAKNLRPNFERHLREPDSHEAYYEGGKRRVTLLLPEVQRVPAGILPMRSG
ncbi:MAG: hypothetical protein HY420_01390 [Candidatus Kerfeldbacteria bacterium]|nr:hypothetical protein [Candidatus Kerfeldbacteria bacterium]